jgi:purine nucleosidase
MAEVWFQSRPEVTFHDPLAAVSIFNPAVCTYTRGEVTTELLSPELAGLTHFRPAATGPHEVALGVDPAEFFADYFRITT